jgi:predicted nuclease of predicted toxin-antitoxin system
MKIMLDMNIPLKYSFLLRNKGFDAVRWQDVGALDAADEEIVEYVIEHDFIILTCDLDFSAILSSTRKNKPSIIQLRVSVIHAEHVVELVTVALKKYFYEISKGAILSIDTKNSRIRLLPL